MWPIDWYQDMYDSLKLPLLWELKGSKLFQKNEIGTKAYINTTNVKYNWDNPGCKDLNKTIKSAVSTVLK